MEMLMIEGGASLAGEVTISGSKNSALPIVIATMLSDKPSLISNVPDLADTRFLCDLLSSFGAVCQFDLGRVHMECHRISNNVADYDLVRKMRASILVLAPLLVRFGRAIVSLPGGCAIGSRPVDIHLSGLTRLGAVIEVKEGYIYARLKEGFFVGAEFELPVPSVGATENLIMAAVMARGTTVLKRAAREPEVVELCHALNRAGAHIQGIGTSTLIIKGVTSLSGIEHRIRPDRIEAGTFIAMAAATRSTITLKDLCRDDLSNVIERFERAQVRFVSSSPKDLDQIDLTVEGPEELIATDIETSSYPGFPTDMQAQFMASMTVAKGSSMIYERIFENRMMHVPELRRMGADISLRNGIATVNGKPGLSGAPVMATDLRASASLVIAALIAKGTSEIRRVYHLDRGYEDLERKLFGLGARIKRCQQIN